MEGLLKCARQFWITSSSNGPDLPENRKLRGDTQKYILKKLAERVGVPREVLYRQKQGVFAAFGPLDAAWDD